MTIEFNVNAKNRQDLVNAIERVLAIDGRRIVAGHYEVTITHVPKATVEGWKRQDAEQAERDARALTADQVANLASGAPVNNPRPKAAVRFCSRRMCRNTPIKDGLCTIHGEAEIDDTGSARAMR